MQDNIKILMSGVSKMNQTGIYQPHTHPHYQLNHVLRGHFDFVIDEIRYTVMEGDTILVPANARHSITMLSNGPGYYFEVKFTTFSRADKELCDDTETVVTGDTFSPVLLKEMFDEEENATVHSEQIRINYLYSILFKLASKRRREKNTATKYIEISAYSQPIRDTIRFLEKNYHRHLSLEDIVLEMNIKKSSLSRKFKEETSITIFECLMIIRVRKAAELLSTTNMTLAEISETCGFVNVTHFNRVFTKHIMIPPGSYRKHLASQNTYLKDATDQISSPIAIAVLDNRKIDVSDL
ncbi:AraC family transcriptional regulator [Lacrimispora sp.]|uniref:AraC family transcriptional regulator n=1 Tax=Lacrimispora sp. TaxID=2719234 RepID=UPI0028A0B862|nr:AraC family transcriptional regulator [Lacrimispora sp.]